MPSRAGGASVGGVGSCGPPPSTTSLSTRHDFFRLLELGAADAARHGDAFERMRAGELQGILIHGVYGEEVLEPVVERLERHDPPFLQTWFPDAFRSWFYGRNLNLTHPDLPGYFDEAQAFHRQLAALLPASRPLVPTVTSLLSRLDRGRPFRPAPGPEPGQDYMFTTLRGHLPGGYIPAHCDNEQALRPSYRHLRTVAEPHMLSFVLAFTRADAGGALEVYDYRLPPLGEALLSDDRAAARPPLETLEPVAFRIPPGSLMVVDSGRHLHRLSPVEGSRVRWTACSFMARSRAGDATYCWG